MAGTTTGEYLIDLAAAHDHDVVLKS